MRQQSLRISDNLSLPLDWMTLATVVYGARGSGKTHFGGVVAEAVTKEHQRFCAIDLKGDWWGLKAGADGVSEGIPVVVFGGDHADLPLEDAAGVFVADLVAGLHQSVILDLEHLSKGKQVRFLAAFFERLYDKNRDPLLLLLDEAQRYAPQRPMSPDATICLGAVEDLVKLGRKHGIGLVLFTQRGAGLNKEVSELADMLVAFRTPGPLDQDRIKDWLDANATREQRDQVMSLLSGLDTGTAVLASNHPGLRIFLTARIRERETFDSSATPRIGQKRVEPKRLAQVDLEHLRERMAVTIERAKADDPRELRKRIQVLERQLLAEHDANPKVVLERVEVPVLSDDDRAQIAGLIDHFNAIQDCSADISRSLRLHSSLGSGSAPAPEGPKPEALKLNVASAPIKRAPITPSTDDEEVRLGKGERTVLGVLAQWPEGRTHDELAFLAGYSAKASTLGVILGSLRRYGLVEPGKPIRATALGLDRAGGVVELPSGQDLLNHWLNHPRMGEGERRVLQALMDFYPDVPTHDELCLATAYSPAASTMGVILGKLRKLGLVERGVRRIPDSFMQAVA